jgi:hypothetical protein
MAKKKKAKARLIKLTPKQLRELKPRPIRLIAPALAFIAGGAVVMLLAIVKNSLTGRRRQ